MEDSIITLPIDQEIRQKLVFLLNEFNSHRMSSVKKSKIIIEAIDDNAKVISLEKHKKSSVEKKKKSRGLSIFEKLFITEYSA